jgi:pimeloyl-ACP methyl ester carboxylesterase
MQRTIANQTRELATMSRRTLIKGLAAGLAAGALGDRSAPAAPARPETALPAPKFIQTNGIRMAVYEQGQGEKIPLVLCHGFPELAYSWRHQLPALAGAGYQAIAPDQRGYGLTERPAAVDAYTIVHLCNDLVGLLDAKGIERAVFCGHDWGGIVAWMMPLLHPDRMAGVIGVNTPLMRRPPAPPIQLLRQIRGEDNYIVAFQQPEAADKMLAADVRKTFTLFMRRGGLFNAAAFAKLPPEAPERKFQLLKMLAAPVESYSGEVFLTPSELDFFVDTYTKTGFTGGINWYRNIDRNWELTKDIEYQVKVPSLYVGAENDVVLPPSSANGMEQMIGDLEKRTIADCGHWTQQEKPEEFNRIVIDWLNRKFGDGPKTQN